MSTIEEEKVEANRDAALEVRLRRMWKQDIDAAYRGQISDILSHVESRVSSQVSNLVHPVVSGAVNNAQADTREALTKHDARVSESIAAAKKSLEDEVAKIVVKILAEYGVKGRDNQPIKFE
jgi:hypothetical protein